tara:strand:+ start:322 stop:603 length:282 start_codon:yes stop_codon:yes gene_type:complete
MKKIILILLFFFSLNTLTYSSFPITESPTVQLSESMTEASVSDILSVSWVSWWNELHWAWKALLILIAFTVLVYVIATIVYNIKAIVLLFEGA